MGGPKLPPSYYCRFDAGSGMAAIRHPSILKLGEFHTIRLHRNLTQGSLVVDGHPPVNGSSQVSRGRRTCLFFPTSLARWTSQHAPRGRAAPAIPLQPWLEAVK